MSIVTRRGDEADLGRGPYRARPGVYEVRAMIGAYLHSQGVPVEVAAAAMGVTRRSYYRRVGRAVELGQRAREVHGLD